MSGITVSQLPKLGTVTATDPNILLFVTDQDSGNSSVALPLNIVFNSFSDVLSVETNNAYNTANLALFVANSALPNTGGSIAGSLAVSGNITTNNVTCNGLQTINPVFYTITANATITLASNTSTNILIIANSSANVTIVMPTSNNNGQICSLSTVSNNSTLLLGAGLVKQSFAGAAPSGSKFKYVYDLATNTWYTTI